MNRRLQFQRCSEHFIGVHNEPPSVGAMRVSAIQSVRPLKSTVATQPQFQPALMRLSAMIPNTSFDHIDFYDWVNAKRRF
jgi:hypothetical protein